MYAIGTSETLLIREVSLFQGLKWLTSPALPRSCNVQRVALHVRRQVAVVARDAPLVERVEERALCLQAPVLLPYVVLVGDDHVWVCV